MLSTNASAVLALPTRSTSESPDPKDADPSGLPFAGMVALYAQAPSQPSAASSGEAKVDDHPSADENSGQGSAPLGMPPAACVSSELSPQAEASTPVGEASDLATASTQTTLTLDPAKAQEALPLPADPTTAESSSSGPGLLPTDQPLPLPAGQARPAEVTAGTSALAPSSPAPTNSTRPRGQQDDHSLTALSSLVSEASSSSRTDLTTQGRPVLPSANSASTSVLGDVPTPGKASPVSGQPPVSMALAEGSAEAVAPEPVRLPSPAPWVPEVQGRSTAVLAENRLHAPSFPTATLLDPFHASAVLTTVRESFAPNRTAPAPGHPDSAKPDLKSTPNSNLAPDAARPGQPQTAAATTSPQTDLAPRLTEDQARALAKALLPVESPEPATGAPAPNQVVPQTAAAQAAPPPTTPSVASPANPTPSLPVTQVDGGFRWMLKNGNQEAQLQLHPEALGQVTIHLRVEGGEVHARLWVQEPGTVQIIQDGRGHLEQSLKDQGLQLGSFDLHQGHRPFQEPAPTPAFFHGPASAPAPARQEAPVTPSPSVLNPHRIELYA